LQSVIKEKSPRVTHRVIKQLTSNLLHHDVLQRVHHDTVSHGPVVYCSPQTKP